jgi:hypothetical protein
VLQPGDKARALPELAIMPVHLFRRDVDRRLVVVSFNPFGGRDLIDPIEAVKPVTCHVSKPSKPARPKAVFAPVTMMAAIGFIML